MSYFGLQQATALWYNMREEVVVYINGQPFVLREDERPFKNMQVRLTQHLNVWGASMLAVSQ